MAEKEYTLDHHFTSRDPVVREIYDALITALSTEGPYEQSPKKTSIILERHDIFAVIQTRKDFLMLTLTLNYEVEDKRITQTEKLSSSRYDYQIKLTDPAQVDEQLITWLKQAFDLAV
jgi:hypothetical protein